MTFSRFAQNLPHHALAMILAKSALDRFPITMPRSAGKVLKSAPPDYKLLAQFRYQLRKFLGFSEAASLAHGVTPQQYQVLLAIEGFPGRNWVTMGELAEQMQVVHHSAVGLVDRMERLKLLRRVASKQDRRSVRVGLTAKGLAVLEKLFRAHREELHTAAPQLVALLSRAMPANSGPLKKEGTASAGKGKEFSSPACAMPEIED